jgi:uncharacterized damage-inducible protein DinB
MESFLEDYLQRMKTLHNGVERALDGLPAKALDWSPGQDIPSLAVLITHLTGSERYWVGDVAMGEASGRDREAEFRVKGLALSELEARLADTLAYTSSALSRLTTADLVAGRVSPSNGEQVTAGWALMHALEHTGIHLGHIQIVRQLWDQRQAGGN